MNTEKAFWNEKGFEGISNLQVHHLTKAEFDHGATRNRGMRFSRADIVVFMTDDAVPADEFLIEKLMGAFDQRGPEGEAVIMAYARQLPDKDCPLQSGIHVPLLSGGKLLKDKGRFKASGH